jgi:guanylate kinase
MKKGKCIIISAPSGAGKTTIVKQLLTKDLNLSFSISACSREKRLNEVDQKDYYFLSLSDFKNKIEANEFVEWEEVYPNQFYGTLKKEIERIWANGNHVIFDVDVVGGLNLKKKFGEQALAIFIMPPSIEVLKQRLIQRNTESEEKLLLRINKADKEIEFAKDFDAIIINEDLTKAVKQAEKLIQEFIL